MNAWLLKLHRWGALLFALPLRDLLITGLILSFEPWLVTRAIAPASLKADRIEALLARHDAKGAARGIVFPALSASRHAVPLPTRYHLREQSGPRLVLAPFLRPAGQLGGVAAPRHLGPFRECATAQGMCYFAVFAQTSPSCVPSSSGEYFRWPAEENPARFSSATVVQTAQLMHSA